MDRRTFLRRAGLTSGALLAGGVLAGCSDDGDGSAGRPSGTTAAGGSTTTRAVPSGSILDGPASSAPIDHVVVVMMENRSFDHWLGWMAEDEAWLEAGRRSYGDGFGVAGKVRQTFPGPRGDVDTAHLRELLADGNPWRGCGHLDPGHGWNSGRAQRDGGFLDPEARNDEFALGYYLGDDLPFSSILARRFTVCDHSFASILGPTYPNREYLHSAQSGGNTSNDFPASSDGFPWDTIWDRLGPAGVDAGYYYTDLPVLALWGPRLSDRTHQIDDYFSQCEDGTLPAVSFVDPGFVGGSQTDNHPHGDIRAGEGFVRDVFAAFARSPQWERGLFVLTYDEWGGFFDHVAPPRLDDDRASDDDALDFGQAGFRVPTVLASPYARPGSVDARVYDHTSILRFLEWRFLGAPAEGPGRDGDDWFLTARDRNALNIGASLVTTPTTELGLDLDVPIAPPSPPCLDGEAGGVAWRPDKHAFELDLDAGHFERLGYTSRPSAMAKGWTY